MERADGPRRDVVANRARIVAAATTMLRERGLDVDMRAIAREAGVGVGTLYRHFPTRQHLVKEITNTDLAGLATSGLPPGPSAIDALRAFFTAALTPLVHNRAAVDLLANADPSGAELQLCVAHLTGIGHDAVERSRTDSTLADDITATDIAYQFLGVVRIVQLLPRPAVPDIEHHVELALRALRPRSH
ncbi:MULTISPECIES: TetR/AcrR family transcriptional regulator [unclassified Parafrankia]|uniref:TetR/AcrR family transcriptional regulator n=1 Tax=unclassified Parafrankia TaxID=2994368 RepID=UPI000DA59248|nr:MULTISPECIES: TetR/AcrR family transcriptional regulator [unclassified Parafrankia]TCJ38460.1 TetR/AcrR family transcriptional regulator [Parafrankia sp. BMG5.11]SQD96429.1 Transcriptional regulator, TetR family [Parafrankia sp. Ea1.12]